MTDRAGAEAIRIMISAPTALRRGILESIVRSAETTKLVGGVYGLDGLARHIRQFQPDVLLADLEQQDTRLIAAASGLDEQDAPINAVALIDHPEASWMARAIRAGVKAIIGRNAPPDEVHLAIQSAFSGLVLLESDGLSTLLRRVRPVRTTPSAQSAEALTVREIEVLRMLADGLANKAISARLGISEHTVKFHISSLLAKMGAASRTEAVTQGIRMGLILI